MATLTYGQIEKLWTRNGGNPMAAPVMAAIALAESGGRTDALNTKPPDYSVGLFQVNYYGSLGPSRTAQYGSPAQLISDPNAQAKAAIAISGNGTNLRPWSTYTSGAYKNFLDSNAIPAFPNISGSPTLEAAGKDQTYDEGYLFQFQADPLKSVPLIGSIAPSATIGMRNSTARKIVGAGVMVGAAIVGGAGLFLLMGRKLPLPGPLGAAQGAVAIRIEDQAGRRAQSRQAAAERSYRSARAEGERAADEAGEF